MSFTEIAGSGITLGESLWGEPFTIGGVAYRGTIADVRGEARLAFNGIDDFADLVIEAGKSQFSAAPSAAPRVPVTARGLSWVIVGVSSDELIYSITCKLRS